MVARLAGAAWSYRNFIVSSVLNDYKSRFGRSKFGTLWVVLHPLAQALVFALVLSNVLAAKLPGIDNKYAFAAYLLAGILCWNLFSEILSRCVTVFIDNATLLKKMNFPRISLPVIVVGNVLVSNLALFLVILVLFPILGIMPNIHWLWFPVLVTITASLATGLGLFLGTLNVFSRDVGQVMAIVLQFWFWLTPIAYPLSIIPDNLKTLLVYNPVAPLVMSYHNIFVYGKAPVPELWISIMVTAIFLVLGFIIFRRASAELVDAL